MNTSHMQFVEPCEEYLESYYQACVESWGYTYDDYIIHDPAKYDFWKGEIFRRYRDMERGMGLPAGYVPSKTYWAVKDGEYAGTVNVRLWLNDALRAFGGHVGFFLRKSLRGTGCSKELIVGAIRLGRENVADDIVIFCETSNRRGYALLDAMNDSGELPYLSRQIVKATHAGHDIEAVKFVYSR